MNRKMLNKRLERIQIGRDDEVPIENNSSLWMFWYYEDGSWDSDSVANCKNILIEWERKNVKQIFCVWHGNYKTNLFLMNEKKIIKRFKAMNK